MFLPVAVARDLFFDRRSSLSAGLHLSRWQKRPRPLSTAVSRAAEMRVTPRLWLMTVLAWFSKAVKIEATAFMRTLATIKIDNWCFSQSGEDLVLPIDNDLPQLQHSLKQISEAGALKFRLDLFV